jgi:hypothetical protein
METVSDTGPSFCLQLPRIGSRFRSDYQLAQTADTLSFIPPDPVDWPSYTARVKDLNFDAANPSRGSIMGMCAHYVEASTLTGSFTPDYTSFNATETTSWTLDSGEVKTISFSWVGTRRE